MLPPTSDPKWEKILTEKTVYRDIRLPTQMILTRLRVSMTLGSKKLQTCIEDLHAYFKLNETQSAGDIKTIFG